MSIVRVFEGYEWVNVPVATFFLWRIEKTTSNHKILNDCLIQCCTLHWLFGIHSLFLCSHLIRFCFGYCFIFYRFCSLLHYWFRLFLPKSPTVGIGIFPTLSLRAPRMVAGANKGEPGLSRSEHVLDPFLLHLQRLLT